MLDIIFHMLIAFLVLAGVVYLPIFSWLKMNRDKDIDYLPGHIKHELKTDLTRPFAAH